MKQKIKIALGAAVVLGAGALAVILMQSESEQAINADSYFQITDVRSLHAGAFLRINQQDYRAETFADLQTMTYPGDSQLCYYADKSSAPASITLALDSTSKYKTVTLTDEQCQTFGQWWGATNTHFADAVEVAANFLTTSSHLNTTTASTAIKSRDISVESQADAPAFCRFPAVQWVQENRHFIIPTRDKGYRRFDSEHIATTGLAIQVKPIYRLRKTGGENVPKMRENSYTDEKNDIIYALNILQSPEYSHLSIFAISELVEKSAQLPDKERQAVERALDVVLNQTCQP